MKFYTTDVGGANFSKLITLLDKNKWNHSSLRKNNYSKQYYKFSLKIPNGRDDFFLKPVETKKLEDTMVQTHAYIEV